MFPPGLICLVQNAAFRRCLNSHGSAPTGAHAARTECVFGSNRQTHFVGWTERKATVNITKSTKHDEPSAAERESISLQGSVD